MPRSVRKRFGQHFLHDPGTIRRIVEAIDPQPGQCMAEIGPGPGAITRALLERLGRLHAVELDRDLIPELKAHCAGLGDLIVHNEDALRFDFARLAAPGHKLRIAGNLPYNISTPLIFHLLGSAKIIEDMHFLLQKEVVGRLTAAPGGGDYGRLTVMAQYHCRSERLFIVKSGAFSPPPKVDSAFVRLIPHDRPPVEVRDPRRLVQVVALAFSQRRKTARNALKGLLSDESIAAAGVDPGLRPENLSLSDFAALTRQIDVSG